MCSGFCFRSTDKTFTSMQNVENLIHVCAHAHTHAHTNVESCPGQDAGNASFCWHLLEGKLGFAAVVWHQYSKTDTIYHQPLSMETFITSWQENLVENNHWGFDNSLDTSFTPLLDGILLWFTIHYQQMHSFIMFYILCSLEIALEMLLRWRANLYYADLGESAQGWW